MQRHFARGALECGGAPAAFTSRANVQKRREDACAFRKLRKTVNSAVTKKENGLWLVTLASEKCRFNGGIHFPEKNLKKACHSFAHPIKPGNHKKKKC